MHNPKFAMHLMPALLTLPLVTACVGSPPIIADKAPCSGLIPDSWRTPVAGADAPRAVAAPKAVDPVAQLLYAQDVGKAWMEFAIGQTAQLEKANGRQADTIAIVTACEARDRAAVEKSRPKFLGIF